MSKVLRSDKLKRKKPETPDLIRSDLALNKNVVLKRQTASRAIKVSTRLNESIPVTDEKVRNEKKQTDNTANSKSKNPKVDVHKIKKQGKTSENVRKVSSISQQKHAPLRPKEVPTTSKVIRTPGQNHKVPTTNMTSTTDKAPVYRKQNVVLDTPHNVTVCSPPPKKRNDYRKVKVVSDEDKKSDYPKLIRKGSRTLAPDEIVILKREPDPIENNETIEKENLQAESTFRVGILKSPVAFEVNFEGNNVKERLIVPENDEEINYSDDFDSYESDFETDSLTGSLEECDLSCLPNKEIPDIITEKTEHCEMTELVASQESSFNQLTSNGREHKHDSEVIADPIVEIQIYKENKFDSGHYETLYRKLNTSKSSDMSSQFSQPITDSLETSSMGMSEQADSGISTCATSIPVPYNKSIAQVTYGGYRNFYTKPIINTRGSELMTKIQLDVLSFTLADLKPISYEIFMHTFGTLSSNQNFTQTDVNQINVEQQTEVQDTRSMWTQNPAQFLQLEVTQNLNNNGIYNQHSSGEVIDDYQARIPSHCELEQSLHMVKQLNSQNSKSDQQNYASRHRRPIDYENLSSFLLRSSILIDQILGFSNGKTKNEPIHSPVHENDQVLTRVCEKYFCMETNFLNTLHVVKLFSNNKYNLLITVHESLPDTNVYISDFTNLLMVWCTNTCDKPLRLLTTWSQVSKVEISNDSSDIIVAALRDGSIALWDLRETHSFCSKLDGCLTHFAATQSIIPSWCGDKNNSKSIMDMGACLDIKSFRSHTNNMLMQTAFPKTQFASLHDSGFIIVWTITETSEIIADRMKTEKYEKLKCSSNYTQEFEYTSPWARVKLKQSALVNIKEYLETRSHHSQSRFDKIKAFFQKNIYSDEFLKELHGCTSDVGQQGIRFSGIECGSENLFICTNQNFILMCSKTLKMEKLKRITINDTVGLSNGVVMILNCQSRKVTQTHKKAKESVGIYTNSNLDSNALIGKSCTIQNILLNVQKSYEDIDYDQKYRPSTAECIALIDSRKKPFELRILDQQVIMSGSVLRKNLIQSLELSSDGWYLFALANGFVRIYDFYLDQEIPYEESKETSKIIGIATGKCGCRENNLMILRPKRKVEVHVLNK